MYLLDRVAARKCAKSCPVPLLSLLLLLSCTAADGAAGPAGAAASPAYAGAGAAAGPQTSKWSFHPGIQFGEIYTDNIALAPAGRTRSEFVTEASPYLSLNGRGPRLQLNLSYRMQNFFFAKNSSSNRIYHLLNAQGTAALVKNFLFFDARSYMSQQIINPAGKVFLGNFSSSGNRTDVRTYSFSPYIHYDFGTTATTEVRYTYSRLTYSQFSQSNNRANSYNVNLASGPSFYRFSWALNYNREKVLYDRFPSVSFQSAIGQVGWLLSRSFKILGTVGYDKNQYVTINGRNSGKRWSIGFSWAPSRRTSFSAAYGRRYYGNNYQAQFKHLTRFTTWEASYSIEATTTRNVQQSSTVVGLINPAGQISYVNFIFPTLKTQVYILRNAELSMTRSLKSGSASLSLYQLRRDFQTSGERTDTYGARASISWRLSRRGTLDLSGLWSRYKISGQAGTYDYVYGILDYKHELSRNVYYTLQYRRFSRLSQVGGDYTENVISAYLNMQI